MNRPLRVVQLTDTHLFADPRQTLLGCPTWETLQQVVAQVVVYDPDLVLLTGDLSQDESDASYERLVAALQLLSCPIYWLAGNHDAANPLERILTTGGLCPDKRFQAGGWYFALLDSTLPGEVGGFLSPTVLAELATDLAQHPEPTLIALHHPLFPVGSPWLDDSRVRNPEALWSVLDAHPQVRVVLCGHVHQEHTWRRCGVTYYSTPSTCIQFAPQAATFALDTAFPGFRWLELLPDGQHTSGVVRVPCSITVDSGASGY
ncbi:MAG: 3',5'-cyclic-AMP phosphodiesterase [Gloeomargarita sp. SKYBB_i_bin120]|nr:3',5'-cyclic-AMP phosphodiesterase [Gloeomargarita sp. SKYG98]MCS7291439.1 3',5'-cyclic-AMP phosphodiesterase [Gloeomargarita sp. SKYB120]MDW8176999.1 3',5'-cyclic-AMP phosphodiesterase [Gloeomargarita sp. SKYBB_i_bin120]